jgi:ssDNA-binding Zn-finger/Zn-ribbon topoisomerase 1
MRFDDPARLRRMMLWIMLGALAASGALAVLGILTGSFEESYRTIGTGAAAVVASGLLLAACKLLDSEKTRRTGLFLMGLIVAEFILTLLAMWDPLRMGAPYHPSEGMFDMTALCFAAAAVPVGLFFHVRGLRGGRVAGLLGMTLCAAAFASFLMAIWLGLKSGWALEDYFWGTGWACWLFAFAAAASTAGAGTDSRHWRWAGLAASTLAFSLGLHNVWTENQTPTNLFIVSTTLGILIGHANIIWLCKLNRRQRWLRWATVAFAWFAGATIDYAIIDTLNADVFLRVGTAAAVCASCGTVAVAILTAFNRRVVPMSGDEVDATEITIVCPVCRKKQAVPLAGGIGDSACAGCGMVFSIRARAPRCPSCNYLLLMHQSERCPECGAAVTRPAFSAATVGVAPNIGTTSEEPPPQPSP